MRLLVLCIAVPLCAQNRSHTDNYPEIRTLLREAEVAGANVHEPFLYMQPSYRVGGMYARAGYLEDAERAFGQVSETPYALWKARVLYGDLEGAEKTLDSITNPDHRSSALLALADLLWRMSEPEKAQIRFEAARKAAVQVINPGRRKTLLDSISRGLAYVNQEPPLRVSAAPKPQKRFDPQDSSIPLFPISTNGFHDLDSAEVTRQVSINAEFMKSLYERMSAGDRDGLLRIAEGAKTPFQRALGMASIEHILIQANQPAGADEYARKIGESNSDCVLAKAEALTAAGAAWLRVGDSNAADADFKEAIRLVNSVHELPLAKVSVVTGIATAQFKGGMAASSGTTLKLAEKLTFDLPIRPVAPKGTYPKTPPGVHYRDEAYNKILREAIRAHNLGAAHEVADLWMATARDASSEVVRAWLYADRVDDALAFARGIKDVRARVSALLDIAAELLDRAGAPTL